MVSNYKRHLTAACALVAALAISCSPPHVRQRSMRIPEIARGRVLQTAERYIGVPYSNGGSTPRGFDCSGYVQYVYRKNGLSLPRTASAQFACGTEISRRQLRPGDPVFFFINSGTKVSHVGIYAGEGRFLHAPGIGKNVSAADLDNPYWKRRYAGAVTYFR